VAPNSAAARSVQNIARKLENMEPQEERNFGIVQLFSSVLKAKFNR